MKLLFLLSVLFSGTLSATAQSDCPTISVNGPDGITSPGELVPFTVRINPPEKAIGVSYLWTVNTSDREVGMVRGQGTSTIHVPWTFASITVTVTVKGLPEGCATSESETTFIDPPPMAEK